MDLSKNLSAELKAEIDALSHLKMAEKCRYGESNDAMLTGDAGAYFKDRLFNFYGGFTPTISKRVGW